MSRVKNKERLTVIFDIGSASVAGALVSIEKDNKPRILYSVRKDMVFQEELDFELFRISMLRTLDDVANILAQDGLRCAEDEHKNIRSPRQVRCFFSSPWFFSQTREVAYSPSEPFRVTEKLISDIVDDEAREFMSSQNTARKIGSGNRTLIEKQVVRIKLNGYETLKPYGQEVSRMDLTFIMSVVPEKLLKETSELIRKKFAVEDLAFGAFPTALFSVARYEMNAPEQFLAIDISGELTDVSIVKNYIPIETNTFPMGKKSVIRILAKKLNTNPQEALSLLHLYYSDSLEQEQKKRTGKALKTAAEQWGNSFRESLSYLSEHFSVPEVVYLAADIDVSRFFADIIQKEEFKHLTMLDITLRVTEVTATLLHTKCHFYNDARRDPFIMLESIFVDGTKEAHKDTAELMNMET